MKSELLKCYKIVLKNDFNKLVSIGVDHLEQICVEYVPGQLTVPKLSGSKLFVFAELTLLLTELESWVGKYEVWECETTGPLEPIQSVGLLGVKDISAFWFAQSLGPPKVLQPAPEGCMMVPDVTLIRRIESW